MKRELIYRTDAMAAVGNLKGLSDTDKSKAMKAVLGVPAVPTCDDAVSRQAVLELTMQYCPDDDGTCSKAGSDIRELLDDIEHLPSAQPEIIACGDCKHWICHDIRCGYWNHGAKPLDWCCHAERRTDER